MARKMSAQDFNPLAPGKYGFNFKNIIFEPISWIDTSSANSKIFVRWMPQNSTDDKSTLVKVMTWCRQATSHFLSQCWPISLSPHDVTRPQWVLLNCYSNYISIVLTNVIWALSGFQVSGLSIITRIKWMLHPARYRYENNAKVHINITMTS